MSRILIATRKGLFRAEFGAGRTKITAAWFLGDHVSMCLADSRDGKLYAALNHGHFGVKIHRSTDDGHTWEELPAPAYPAQPEGETETDMWGRTMEWKLRQIWALEPSGKDRPGELWCGTIPGGLFHSKDFGENWELVESLWYLPERKKWMGGGADYPGIHSICIDPRDSKRILVGVSCGGAWLTTDGGETWSIRSQGMRAAFLPPELQYDPVQQDPHLIDFCRNNPDFLWCQHHNGIFRSVNGGESWTEIVDVRPSVFGFGLAVHPQQPDTAWFVPGQIDEKRIPVEGKVVVTRTRDGGKNFDILTNGLPQEHAYDLVYRHALVVDSTGEKLAFGSTTGSCYVSENQGDEWSCVSEHLPPIYAIRFNS